MYNWSLFLGKNAFTFAEVMITITVIGVVAALTMPSIVKHYHEKEYVAQLQKSISQFEQAMQNIMFRYECTDIVCTGVFNGDTSNNEWNNKFEEEIRKSIKVLDIKKKRNSINANFSIRPSKTKIYHYQ